MRSNFGNREAGSNDRRIDPDRGGRFPLTGGIIMHLRTAALVMFVLWLPATMTAQKRTDDEELLKKLEQRQVDLLLKGDVKEMAAAWGPEFTVNNPFNEVVNGHEGPIRLGKLTYSSFTRVVERITFHNEIAIVMGRETVVPSGRSVNAGQELKRRFTTVWFRSHGEWKMLARHANVICHP